MTGKTSVCGKQLRLQLEMANDLVGRLIAAWGLVLRVLMGDAG
jgi:hypothetical protein